MASDLANASRSLSTLAKSATLFAPFDQSTAAGRSKERYRRAALTTLASTLAKTISVASALISVPLTLRYLGTERYGLWITISSLIAFLSFSDLGISNGLLNGISKSHGRDDRGLARQYVSSAFFFLTTIAASLGLIFFAAYRYIPWDSIFNVKSPQAISEAGPAAAVFICCFLTGIPASIVTRIQSGYQEGFTANLWTIAGNLMGLASLLIVIKLRLSLMFLVLAMAGVPILATATNGLILFGYVRPWLRPAWSEVRRSVSHDLLHSGVLFFFLQLAMAVGYSSDNLVLSHVLGPSAVTQYAVPSRLFAQVGTLISLVTSPLWPAYSEALARKDYRWVTTTLRRSFMILLPLSAGSSILLVIFGAKIVQIWVGPQVQPHFFLLASLGIWSVVTAVSMPLAVFLNSANIVRFQVITVGVGCLVNITLSIYLCQRIGIPGVVLGSIISQVLVILVPQFTYVSRNLQLAGRQ